MNEIYLWIVTALVTTVAATTIGRLWIDRIRLGRDEIDDNDRMFAWRIALFLIYPAMVGIDLRATVASAQVMGGSISGLSYSLFCFSAIPHGLAIGNAALIVLFAGVAIQLLLALCLLPALFFKPHPFLSTVVGYSVVTIMGVNFILEPLLSLIGFGGSRWHLAQTVLHRTELISLYGLFFGLGALFLLILSRPTTRLWFADLSRPLIAEQLRDALVQYRHEPHSLFVSTRLTLLYERAGMRKQAEQHLKRLQAVDPNSIYTVLAHAVMQYRNRKFLSARQAFLRAADIEDTSLDLRSSLLAAGACSAFAQEEMEIALNLCDKALVFDESSLMARMVKVDVYLRTGRKEEAGDEIIAAIRRGLDMDIESQVPLDIDRTLLRIRRSQTALDKRLQPAQPALRD